MDFGRLEDMRASRLVSVLLLLQNRQRLTARQLAEDREHVPRLAELAEVVWQRWQVRLRYLRWAQPHEIGRTVRPLGLVVKAGTWYLVAQAERIRTYRVSRILELAILDDTFDRPIESVEWAVPELLRLGCDVEVLAPDDLRAAMTQAAAELASLYPVKGAQRG